MARDFGQSRGNKDITKINRFVPAGGKRDRNRDICRWVPVLGGSFFDRVIAGVEVVEFEITCLIGEIGIRRCAGECHHYPLGVRRFAGIPNPVTVLVIPFITGNSPFLRWDGFTVAKNNLSFLPPFEPVNWYRYWSCIFVVVGNNLLNNIVPGIKFGKFKVPVVIGCRS